MYELFAIESDDCSLSLGAVFWSWGNGVLKELAQNPRKCRPVYLNDSGVFCMLKFSVYENKKINTSMNISGHVLLFLCFPVRNMPSSGFSVAHVSVLKPLAAIGVAFFVVSAMNSWVIQNEACISTAKLEHLSFSGRHVEIIFKLFH